VWRRVSRSSSKESLPRGDGAARDIAFIRIESSPEEEEVIGLWGKGREKEGEARLCNGGKEGRGHSV
jgi:hypothetical protein